VKFKSPPNFASPAFENLFGCYHAAWLFLLFLLLIRFRRDALLIMLGVFGGLMLYICYPSPQCYPWDMPAMFFFTLACLLYDRRRMGLLMAVVWLGALFKETTLCCAFLILLGEHWLWKKRLAGFGATVVVTLATYKLLLWLFHIQARIFGMYDAATVHDLFWKGRLDLNLQILFHPQLYHVVFANAGSLLIMLLLPWRSRRDVVFKLLIVAFLIGQFFWGAINEFRIGYELLPLGWMMIADTVLRERPELQDPSNKDNPASRALIGSYWLMMAALLLTATAVWIENRARPSPVINGTRAYQPGVSQLTAAATKGDATAEYNLGRAYQVGFGVTQDFAQAALWYQRAAEQGNLEGQNALGMLLALQKEYANAAQWFGQAATNGNSDAQYNLGVLYHKALGVGQSDEIAAQWFQKAAAQNQRDAQKEMGRLYHSGRGVKKDYVAAYQWLKLAQLQGDLEAEDELTNCAAAMTAEQINAAEIRAKAFKARGR
jgi:TPR repeat protein